MNTSKIPMLIRAAAVAAIVSLATPASVLADVIETVGGSVIRGRVLASEGGVVKIETDFAGVLEVKQDQVKTLTTEETIFVALQDGNTFNGRIETNPAGLRLVGPTGAIQTQTSAITAFWRPGDPSPSDKALAAAQRKWAFEAAFDLNGRNGNSDRVFLGISGRAVLEGQTDRLMFHANYSQAEENDTKTQDEGKVGVDYSNFFSERWSWYARTELGFDGTKDLDLRSQTAAGIGFSIIKTPRQRFEARFGLSYRFENYGLGTDFDSAGLDLGLLHSLDSPWGRLANSVSITPAFDDFSNFVLVHDSSLELPVSGGQPWKLRVGVKTDYTSEPPPGFEELDWTYYSTIVFAWR